MHAKPGTLVAMEALPRTQTSHYPEPFRPWGAGSTSRPRWRMCRAPLLPRPLALRRWGCASTPPPRGALTRGPQRALSISALTGLFKLLHETDAGVVSGKPPVSPRPWRCRSKVRCPIALRAGRFTDGW